jgi:hypothetical protein
MKKKNWLHVKEYLKLNVNLMSDFTPQIRKKYLYNSTDKKEKLLNTA